ncbi:hypothetical protein J1N35_024076 [Gossypium stocksii]|uniref:Uncharacterized protein n=1 Tax=Gossypium stocksii TaxID=47602 RepID=A0A9D3VJ91_9ROSI|nr:hypothetical protein J1N35_024076 [Gossypium stocksii]
MEARLWGFLNFSTPEHRTREFCMSISDFNIAMGFVDPDNIQSDSYHTALLDVPSDFNAQNAYHACGLLVRIWSFANDPKPLVGSKRNNLSM